MKYRKNLLYVPIWNLNYRYIVGVNQDAIEIEMTRPVPIKVTPMKTSPKIDYEMCFWLGTPYESQEVTEIITRKNANE